MVLTFAEARSTLLAVVLLTSMAPEAADATDLACRPGAVVKVFARETLRLSSEARHRLKGDLDAHARSAGWSYAGADLSFYDLISATRGTHLTLTSSGDRVVKVAVSNDCTTSPEDWRPTLATFNAFIIRRYGSASIVHAPRAR